MTVKEVIEILKTMPQDLEVVSINRRGDYVPAEEPIFQGNLLVVRGSAEEEEDCVVVEGF